MKFTDILEKVRERALKDANDNIEDIRLAIGISVPFWLRVSSGIQPDLTEDQRETIRKEWVTQAEIKLSNALVALSRGTLSC
ncbi:MAG: hypothetical protein ACRD41_04235 [Candidatus Acidiferrales bacterium]